MKRLLIVLFMVSLGFLVISCATNVAPNIKYLVSEMFSPKPEGCSLDILETPIDLEKMIAIAELQVFAEQDPLLGQFKNQSKEQYIASASKIACEQGADGIAGVFFQQVSINGTSFRYK